MITVVYILAVIGSLTVFGMLITLAILGANIQEAERQDGISEERHEQERE